MEEKQIVRLFDERNLLLGLERDTLQMIRACQSVGLMKKFIECHDILELTRSVYEQFPKAFPEFPECDEAALLELKLIKQEIFVIYHPELPQPNFQSWDGQVTRLLWAFRVPRNEFRDFR